MGELYHLIYFLNWIIGYTAAEKNLLFIKTEKQEEKKNVLTLHFLGAANKMKESHL